MLNNSEQFSTNPMFAGEAEPPVQDMDGAEELPNDQVAPEHEGKRASFERRAAMAKSTLTSALNGTYNGQIFLRHSNRYKQSYIAFNLDLEETEVEHFFDEYDIDFFEKISEDKDPVYKFNSDKFAEWQIRDQKPKTEKQDTESKLTPIELTAEEMTFPEPRTIFKNGRLIPNEGEVLGEADSNFLAEVNKLIEEKGLEQGREEILKTTKTSIRYKLQRLNILVPGKNGKQSRYLVNPKFYRE